MKIPRLTLAHRGALTIFEKGRVNLETTNIAGRKFSIDGAI